MWAWVAPDVLLWIVPVAMPERLAEATAIQSAKKLAQTKSIEIDWSEFVYDALMIAVMLWAWFTM